MLAIIVILGGLCGYFSFFGVQTMSALEVQYLYRKTPEAAETPGPLPDSSISSVRHKTISYFGYEIELPWDDVDEPKSKTVRTIHVTAFRSGNAFWFSTFPAKELVNEVLKDMKLDPQRFRQLYGDDAFESDYALHRKILQATPSQVTPFVSRQTAISGQMLLLLKVISMPKADSGLFSIQASDFKGFQFESPQARPSRITDELYSDEGGVDLIFLQKTDGSAPMITQPEINRVIHSIRKVPSAVDSPGVRTKASGR